MHVFKEGGIKVATDVQPCTHAMPGYKANETPDMIIIFLLHRPTTTHSVMNLALHIMFLLVHTKSVVKSTTNQGEMQPIC